MSDKPRRGGQPGAREKSAAFCRGGVSQEARASGRGGVSQETRAFARGGISQDARAFGRGDISAEARAFANGVKPLRPLCGVSDAPLPELLLPAGSPLALEAAIEAGADAVYFGARSFSARARATNFDDGEIADALRLCRAYGVKAYAAVNTRVRDAELSEAMRLVELLADAGVDALIAADLGLCALIRREWGEAIELHASTQLTPVSSYDARTLADLGFTRMVAPRELSLGQLAELCENSPIEIEAFVHGAHCVSLSGQCLMSSLIGNRSANRGECAQPCRMNYSCCQASGSPSDFSRGRASGSPGDLSRGGESGSQNDRTCNKTSGALLSLADMCCAPDIPAIISTGVASLKVEGRQKDAAYVYGVGRLYRRLLDERRAASADEIEELASLFERGFTDGYLRGDFHAMRGTRAEDAQSGEPFSGLSRKLAVSASLTLRVGEAPTLTLTSGAKSATASLDNAADAADGEPLSADRVERQIARLGGTPFELADFDFTTDGGAWLCAAELNELRRRAAAKLTDAPERRKAPGASPTDAVDFAPSDRRSPRRVAEFQQLSQIPPEAFGYFDCVYLPYGEYGEAARQAGVHLSLPPYMTDDIARRVTPLIRAGDRVLAHTVGQIAFVSSLGALADLSLRLNVWNAECALSLAKQTSGFITVSPELPAAAMRDISAAVGGAVCVAYGKLPVMYTARCMIRECGKCRGGPGGVTGALRESEACRAYLADRTGARFFVVGGRDCANTIYNSVPTWTADRPVAGCAECFIFTDESVDEVSAIIASYERGEAPRGNARRVR